MIPWSGPCNCYGNAAFATCWCSKMAGWSDRDLKRALDPAKAKKRKLLNLGGLFFLLEPFAIREIMTRDVVTIDPNATPQMAASLMVDMKFGALPVAKDDTLLGIITETDLLKHFAKA
jgi:CBS domain-containing protein